MKTFDELRLQWNEENKTPARTYEGDSLEQMVRKRVKKESGIAFQYFWASFALQLLVYALFSHVMIKYWRDPYVLVPSLINILLYIPFTTVLMRKFKRMATLGGKANATGTMSDYVVRHRDILSGFYRFKKVYEYLLIPLSAIIGTFVTFRIWVPGGVSEFPSAAAMILVITLVSCIVAIRDENRRNFEKPLMQLNAIIDELNDGK